MCDGHRQLIVTVLNTENATLTLLVLRICHLTTACNKRACRTLSWPSRGITLARLWLNLRCVAGIPVLLVHLRDVLYALGAELYLEGIDVRLHSTHTHGGQVKVIGRTSRTSATLHTWLRHPSLHSNLMVTLGNHVRP